MERSRSILLSDSFWQARVLLQKTLINLKDLLIGKSLKRATRMMVRIEVKTEQHYNPCCVDPFDNLLVKPSLSFLSKLVSCRVMRPNHLLTYNAINLLSECRFSYWVWLGHNCIGVLPRLSILIICRLVKQWTETSAHLRRLLGASAGASLHRDQQNVSM